MIGRLAAVALMSAVALVLGVASNGRAASNEVRIVSFTRSLPQGGVWRLEARISPRRTTCKLTFRSPRGSSSEYSARVTNGLSRWAFDLYPHATVGRWQSALSCRNAGKRSVAFVVQRAPLPVVVEAAGFSQVRRGFDAGRSFGIGAVVQNRSRFDAVGVTVTFNLIDGAGRILETESESTDGIPAGTTYYMGTTASSPIDADAVRIERFVTVREWTAPRLRFPSVSNVQVLSDAFTGGTEVVGELLNTTGGTLSSLADISAVLFDAEGNVIGGGLTFPDSSVPPGARVGFRVQLGVEYTLASRVAAVQVSVEPDYA